AAGSGAAEAAVLGTRPEVVSAVAAPGRVALVFPGQGWQWDGMGRELLTVSPVFRETVGQISAVVCERTGWSVTDVLTGASGAADLDRVDVLQPVMFAVMVGLARVWESLGVVPDAVVGHSQGEIAAACVAGVVSLADATRIVLARSSAIAQLAGEGAMLSVAASAERTEEVLRPWRDRLWLAAVNSPSTTVVAGDVTAAEELLAAGADLGLRIRRIPVDYASHSPHVEAVRERVLADLADLAPSGGELPVYSSVTGQRIDASTMDAAYWYRNLRQPVRFLEATRALFDDDIRVLVEASAHPVLTMAIEATAEQDATGATVVGTLRRDDGGLARLQTSAAHLWVAGVDLDWSTLVPAASDGATVRLPTYAFDERRFWLDRLPRGGGDPGQLGLTALDHGFLGAGVEVAGAGPVVLSGRLSTATHPWLADHAVAGTAILPGAGFVDLVVRAGDEVGCRLVEELVLQRPLVLTAEGAVELQVVVDPPGEDGRRGVAVYGRPAGGDSWSPHAQGTLAPGAPRAAVAVDRDLSELSGAWPPAGSTPVDVSGLYPDLAARGYGYGPTFQGLSAVWRTPDPAVLAAEVRLPDPAHPEVGRYGLHPALLDAALHVQSFLEDSAPDGVWLPFSWNGVCLLAVGASTARVLVRSTGEGAVRIAIADPAGDPVALVEAMRLRKVDPARLGHDDATEEDLYTVQWFPAAGGTDAIGSVAVVGPDSFGVVGATGGQAFADVSGLADALDTGWRPPDCVVVCAAGTDAAEPRQAAESGPAAVAGEAAGNVLADAHELAERVLLTLQAWLADERFAGVPLVVATRGAVAVDHGGVADLAASVVWGLVRSAQSEHPDRFVLVDADPVVAPDDWTSLLVAAARREEPQLAVREGRVLAARLVRGSGGRLAGVSGFGAGSDWRIDALGIGSVEGVGKADNPRATQALEPGEVRLQVRAAGLNFYDVAGALGLATFEDGLGAEGAGVVTETGPGVTGFAVGDRVFGGFPSAFAPFTIADERMIARMSDDWSFEQAASVPAAFLTALFGLGDLAGVRAGERVLVHAGT
ncbi:acyltransferase domain-containing protein, partial [Frankia sp. AiPs1]|uniref:acyltransferase domain-containing protein n=1 Tax=Frankia sp. AiPs1 TaxID=573493 RepID=UPI00204387B4